MKPRLIALTALLAVALSSAASAGETESSTIESILAARFPGVTLDHISPSPVPGVYEVAIGVQVIYVSADGRYMMRGKLIDLETRNDLTEQAFAKRRLAVLDGISEDRMIVFEPTGKTRHTLTTFTDIDCPFCRKMHREMGELNQLGIRVRYLFYPRAGFPSASYEKAVSVWCAPDQRDEMTRAKSELIPEKRTCEHPIVEHMALARSLGLSGTPFTITDTGRVIAGYRPANALFQSLDADKAGRQP